MSYLFSDRPYVYKALPFFWMEPWNPSAIAVMPIVGSFCVYLPVGHDVVMPKKGCFYSCVVAFMKTMWHCYFGGLKLVTVDYYIWIHFDTWVQCRRRGSVYLSVTSTLSQYPPDFSVWADIFSLQLGFGVKANPLVDRCRVRLHIHWRHLKPFVFFSEHHRQQHLNNRRWAQEIVFGSRAFGVHLCLQLVVPVFLSIGWRSEAALMAKENLTLIYPRFSVQSWLEFSESYRLSSVYSAITLKTRFVLLKISQLAFGSFTSFLLDALDNRHWYLVHQIVNLSFQLLEHIRWDEQVSFIKVLENNSNLDPMS